MSTCVEPDPNLASHYLCCMGSLLNEPISELSLFTWDHGPTPEEGGRGTRQIYGCPTLA